MPDSDPPPPARFSQRLLPAERQSAGLGLLTDVELARLDGAVAKYETHGPSAAASPVDQVTWQPAVQGPRPEIHGLISFTYGVGSGGYSAMGGAMAVSVYDPTHGIGFSASYAEMRTKGRGWCRGYLPGEAFGYDPFGGP